MVIVPLVVGVALRGAQPGLVKRELELSVSSSVLALLLIFASLSDTRGGTLASASLISGAFLIISGLVAVGSLWAFGRRFDATLVLTIWMRDFAVAAAFAVAVFADDPRVRFGLGVG